MDDQAIDYEALAKKAGAVSSAPPPGAHPEARIGATEHPVGMPGLSLPAGSVDAFGMRKHVDSGTEQFMREPLARPTGIDSIDSFLSPASLALMAATAGPSVAKSVAGAVANLTEQAGGAVTKKLLKFVMPSMIKKPAELGDLLTEIGNAVKTKAAPIEVAPPATAAPTPALASNVERKMAIELKARGKTPEQITEAIDAAKKLIQSTGLNKKTPTQRMMQEIMRSSEGEAEFARKYAEGKQ